jgi:DNA-binding transcriptional LysR family regulator
MTHPDLNLLITLDLLLAEGSVAGAARRLHLSPSAMSRALQRLRDTMGDPLLVRAGRGLVPTPRALELRDRVGQIVEDAEAALRPSTTLDLSTLRRSFTFRNRDGFVEAFGAAILARVTAEAPGVQLRFQPKPDRDSTPLREGSVDLETGVVSSLTGPELRTQALFKDRFIGIVRAGHPLATGAVTPQRFAAARHIMISRRGLERGPVDDALATLGLERQIATVVGGFSEALALARSTDLVATVPERYSASLRGGLQSFDLPVPLPGFTVSLLWHPRLDADPAHRWLRGLIREICAA